MGADYIGYLVIGPQTLTPTTGKLTRAKKQAQKILDMVSELGDEHADFETIADRYAPWLKHLNFKSMVDSDFTCLGGLKADKAIGDLLDFWNGSSRDANMRMLHFDHLGHKLRPPIKVVCAGDMTWGDEPDGWGYRTLKVAELLGLFDVFKIG